MRVLAVGGSLSIFNRLLKSKYESYGLDIAWHWDWHSNPKELPQNCEGVVLLQNMVGTHTLSNSVVKQAKERNLPWAMVSSQFTKALPVLRSKGLVPPMERDSTTETVTDTQKLEFVVEYIVSQLKFEQREPRHGEMEVLIERSFGEGTTLSRDIFRTGLSTAKQQVYCSPESEPSDFTQKEEPMNTESTESTATSVQSPAGNINMNESILISKAYAYYLQTIPEDIYRWSLSRFREAVYSGRIEGGKGSDGLWYTTRGAVNTFFLQILEGEVQMPGQLGGPPRFFSSTPMTDAMQKDHKESVEVEETEEVEAHDTGIPSSVASPQKKALTCLLDSHQYFWLLGKEESPSTIISRLLQNAMDQNLSVVTESPQVESPQVRELQNQISHLENQVAEVVELLQSMLVESTSLPKTVESSDEEEYEDEDDEPVTSLSGISLESLIASGCSVTISRG